MSRLRTPSIFRMTATPEEIDRDVDKFNSGVITEPFNRTVCDELARHIDPTLPGKTLIFCANDAHADMVVDLLSQALAELQRPLRIDFVYAWKRQSNRVVSHNLLAAC